MSPSTDEDFMSWFSWKRIATIATGAALVAVGTVFVQPALIVTGVAVVGWAVPFAGDKPEIKK